MSLNPYQSPPSVSTNRKLLLRRRVVAVMLLVAILCLAPPQRRVGDWLDQNGQRPQPSDAAELDRYLWGYIPAYRWVVQVGTRESINVNLTASVTPAIVCTAKTYTWQIDWLLVFWQLWALSIAIGIFELSLRSIARRYARATSI